jgi:transposase-like protein
VKAGDGNISSAPNKHGHLVDFFLAERRDIRAAYRFLFEALKSMDDYSPSLIAADELATYPTAFQHLQSVRLPPRDVRALSPSTNPPNGIVGALIRCSRSVPALTPSTPA